MPRARAVGMLGTGQFKPFVIGRRPTDTGARVTIGTEPTLSIAILEGELATVGADLHLVRRARAGDTHAFDLLYAQHVDHVYAVCLRMCADPVRARELTQDVFVRVWERLGSFRGESRFSSWLHRVAVNVLLDDQRARGRRDRGRVAERVEEVDAAVREVPPGEQLDLDRAIAALPPGARTVLVLHAVEGYRYEEVAELTGLALGTVKAQIHRARQLLKKALDR